MKKEQNCPFHQCCKHIYFIFKNQRFENFSRNLILYIYLYQVLPFYWCQKLVSIPQKLHTHGVNYIIVWESILVTVYKQNSHHLLEVMAISKPLKKGCILFPLDGCAGFG